MGKHGKRGGGGGGRGRRNAVPWGQQKKNGRDSANGNWNNITPDTMKNEFFEGYYKAQGIVPEDEWEPFLDALRTELPTTFRVTGSRATSFAINDLIKNIYVPTMTDVELDGVKYDPPKPLEWYPDHLAWEIAAPKRVVRKQPAFKSFQRFLVGETGVGNLSRQEAVSMIPPLLMDVKPSHNCLDMCAAPGSKTAQIMEALNPHDEVSSGMLMANDADYKRTHMLVHQTGRMPTKGLVVTNFDATMIPNISLGNKHLKFDRILADVPCSGDGTMRKNLEIWAKWAPSDGNSLHPVQLRILNRAMALLQPGGRLVYSTCSFNPSENEAVVAAALNAHPGEYTIVDVQDKLPGLKRRPGITSWKVASRVEDELVWHDSYESYRARVDAGLEREKDKEKGIPETVWAPANAAELGLERSLRLLPHDQNTGGFYVCVLEKKLKPVVPASAAAAKVEIKEEIAPDAGVVMEVDEKATLKRPVSPSAEEPMDKKPKVETTESEKKVESAEPEKKVEMTEPEKKDEAASTSGKKKKGDLAFREDPFSFVDPNHEEVKLITSWFGLKNSFPVGNLLVRNAYGNPLRTIYIVNDVVKSIILNNDYTRLRMISAGVKAFVRQDSQARTEIQCKWRISSDAVQDVLCHIPEEKILKATIRELRILVEEMYPPIEKFPSPFKEVLQAAELGNMLVRFEAGESDGGKLPLPMVLPVWKAKQSMSLLIDKTEKVVLSERVFGSNICKPAPTPKSAPESANESAVESALTSAMPSGAATPVIEAEPAVDEEAALNA